MRFDEKKMELSVVNDFVPRDRTRSTTYLILGFVITIAAVIVAFSFSDMMSSRTLGMSVVSVMLVILCLACIALKTRSNDLVLATEFQNLLFASAANLGSVFSLIVKRDATVIYASPGVKTLFDDFRYSESSTLEGFYVEGRILEFDQAKITNALLLGERKSHLIKVATNEGVIDMVISVEPLPRPVGYYVIKARKYFSQRDGKVANALTGQEATAEQYHFALEQSPTAQFICDEFGRFIYMNQAMQKLCGYSTQDFITNRMQISDMITHTAGSRIGVDYEYQDMDIDALLVVRSGQTLRIILSLRMQKEANRISAIAGSIIAT